MRRGAGDAAVWADPIRTIRTLESFARTEADGARDIATAALRTVDPELQRHFTRHAADERRHAELFARRAAALRAEHPQAPPPDDDKRLDLDRSRRSADVDAHGFFVAGLFDELGEVAYVAMLHVAERRAAALFTTQRALTRHDPQTRAIFEEILRDEQYHVAYTKSMLAQWRRQGRGREVGTALTSARGQRLLGAWKRLGARSAHGLGRVLLALVYWTVCVPFGLVARGSATREGWQAARAPASGLDAEY